MESAIFKTVPYGSESYKKAVELRYLLLRKPLNMVYTKNDEIADSKDIHIIGYFPSNPDKIIANLILHPKGNNEYKMRQVCVDEELQKQGVGSQLCLFSEEEVKRRNGTKLVASARKVIINFYKKLGYTIDGEEYLEVGIPHFQIFKNLT